MSATAPTQAVSDTGATQSGLRPAAPIMASVFLSFLMIGMALPVLPLHVHDVLGFRPFSSVAC